jgi:hypothetical protein
MKKYIYILPLLLIGFNSCLKHKAMEPKISTIDTTGVFPCGDTVYFNNEIMGEILTPSCNTSGCHSSSSVAGGYTFTTYANVEANAAIILKSIKQETGVSPMPKFSNKLNDSLITKFDCWIQQGKLNN